MRSLMSGLVAGLLVALAMVVMALPASSATTVPVQVYFSNNLNNPASVVAVTRYSPNAGVANYALQEIIGGPTPAERTQGLFSEWNSLFTDPSHCGIGGPDFKVSPDHKGSKSEAGTWTVQFCRNIASPGVGTDARVTTEITRTLLQFSNIKKVVILTLQGHCFGDESGLDRCLQ